MATIVGAGLGLAVVTTALNLGHSLEVAAYQTGAFVTTLLSLVAYVVIARVRPDDRPAGWFKTLGTLYLGGVVLSAIASLPTSSFVLRRLVSEALTWPVFLPIRLIDVLWG